MLDDLIGWVRYKYLKFFGSMEQRRTILRLEKIYDYPKSVKNKKKRLG